MTNKIWRVDLRLASFSNLKNYSLGSMSHIFKIQLERFLTQSVILVDEELFTQ